MDSLPIRQQNDPQIPAFHFLYSSPSPYSSICLYVFSVRMLDNVLNPFVLDHLSIRSTPNRLEVRWLSSLVLTVDGITCNWRRSRRTESIQYQKHVSNTSCQACNTIALRHFQGRSLGMTNSKPAWLGAGRAIRAKIPLVPAQRYPKSIQPPRRPEPSRRSMCWLKRDMAKQKIQKPKPANT